MNRKLLKGIIISAATLLVTSCVNNQADDIARSIEDLQFNDHDGLLHDSNMKEQNKERVRVELNTATYADEFGYYLDKFYVYMRDIRDFFYSTSQTNEDVQKVLQTLDKIETLRDSTLELVLPEEFIGLHHVHMAALIEFDSLKTTIETMETPDHTEMVQARVFYENTIISLKQMEREYKEVLMELGLK